MSTDLDEIWQTSVVARKTWAEFEPNECTGGSRPNEKVFSVVPEMHHNSCYNSWLHDLHDLGGKPINVWGADCAIVKNSGSF